MSSDGRQVGPVAADRSGCRSGHTDTACRPATRGRQLRLPERFAFDRRRVPKNMVPPQLGEPETRRADVGP